VPAPDGGLPYLAFARSCANIAAAWAALESELRLWD
jgi:hypothetical protein